MGIEIIKRNGPKRIQISIDAVCHRRITIKEAKSLRAHLSEVIDWAVNMEDLEMERFAPTRNRKG